MARRDRERRDDRREVYGGVRDTPRTRSTGRTVTTRVADQRDPLDAIGGRFITPDLTVPEYRSPFVPLREPVNRVIARAAAPTVVSPSKRSAIAKAAPRPPERVVTGRAAEIRSRGVHRPADSLGRRLTGELSRLAPVPSPRHPAAMPLSTPRPDPVPARTVAREVRAATEHVQRSPEVRDPRAATCKPRPKDNRAKGGAGSREFVPWCDRRR